MAIKNTNNTDSALIFVSHSSLDKGISEFFTRFIYNCFYGLEANDVICTSSHEQGLKFGDGINETIKKNINNAIVICIITKNSISSQWVMYEVGISHMSAKKFIPLLCNFDIKDLPSFISPTHAADINSRDDLKKLMREISQLISKKIKESVIESEISIVQNAIRNLTLEFSEKLLLRKEAINEFPLKKLSDIATEEFYVWGLSIIGVSNERIRNAILDMTSRSVCVKLLMIDRESAEKASKFIKFGPICSFKDEELHIDIDTSQKELRRIYRKLNDSQRKYFICKTTNWNITWSGISVDPFKANGIIQVESYLYNYIIHEKSDDPRNYRINLVACRNSRFYNQLAFSLKELWENAQIVDLG